MLAIVAACAATGPAGKAVAADRQTPAADRQTQVLVLYSTRRDAQIAVVGDRELPRLLEEGLNHSVDYYSEYLDRARFPDPDYRAAFSDFLQRKYQGQQFDVVIATSDIALQFVDRDRTPLLRDTPIVYFSNATVPVRPENSVGVIADLHLDETVALAASLQPNLHQVFVVTGTEPGDRQYEQLARVQLRPFESRLTVTYLSGLRTTELEQRVSNLPADSMVYFLMVSRDGAGENFHPLEYVERVTAVANVPTYSWVDSAMGHGIVGGRLKSQEAETAAIAALALRILRGESADRLPSSTMNLNVPQVDWRQLRRWGISEARVPAGTRVLFREPSAWDRYRGYILGAVALLLAQAALIGGLLAQGARRRNAEMQLRVSQNELHTAYARLIGAEEAERSRIARDLHDNIGQRMAAMTMELDALDGGPPAPAGEWGARIHGLSTGAMELARDIQSISRVLHGSSVDYLGLRLASSGFCRDLSKQQKITVDFSSQDMPDHVPPAIGQCVFRVLQEALNNAVRHSGARHIAVSLGYAHDAIHLKVVDDGMGFDPAVASGRPGLGLISMRERIGLEGGRLSVESSPGAGTIVRAQVPMLTTDAAPVVRAAG